MLRKTIEELDGQEVFCLEGDPDGHESETAVYTIQWDSTTQRFTLTDESGTYPPKIMTPDDLILEIIQGGYTL